MPYSVRKMMQRILPGVNNKSAWTLNETELIELLSNYIHIGKSSTIEVQEFLDKQKVLNNVTIMDVLSSAIKRNNIMADFAIVCFLPGPTLWESRIPSGSKYDICLLFQNDVLVFIDVSLVILEI